MLFPLHVKHLSDINTLRKMVNGEYSDLGGTHEEAMGVMKK